jgi:hypothetical protein
MSTQVVNNWRDFARILVETKELDPMYDFIYNARSAYSPQWADRFALHFFMFYDAGEAIHAANVVGSFWQYVEDHYDVCKRGTERRHFRGKNGWNAIMKLQSFGTPTQVWDALHNLNYAGLVSNVEANFEGAQIGPYFTWKAMDLLDRCLNRPVDLSLVDAMRHLPDEPRKAAKQFWPNKNLSWVLDHMVEFMHYLEAPGMPGSNCGYAEVETVLCAMYGYWVKGNYYIGKDLERRHNELSAFPELLKYLPAKVNANDYTCGPLEPATVSA